VRSHAAGELLSQRRRLQRLSQVRAEAVMQHLIEKSGVDATRLEAVGFGESRPIADNTKAHGRAVNRRVEFVIVERR
jgi:outer membrane protein OmpA-like peptidoglycan-associated protein